MRILPCKFCRTNIPQSGLFRVQEFCNRTCARDHVKALAAARRLIREAREAKQETQTQEEIERLTELAEERKHMRECLSLAALQAQVQAERKRATPRATTLADAEIMSNQQRKERDE